ncbi:MAG: amino acid transporter [Chloroflexota bacterium]|nr:amino acid transporter [Chloroflexota bacterium]
MTAVQPVTAGTAQRPGRLRAWLLDGAPTRETDGPFEPEREAHQHPWWQVMCLTGVDYFSTLGYQPGIAALAAGALSPIATLILVLVTLFGALPMYKRVAAASPHGDGSISMLERLMGWWQGKLLVLCLIGFVATGFIITITLSAADATAHIAENPYSDFLHGHEVVITLVLISLLGAVFLRGFGEAIGIAVALVAVYLTLNVVVIIAALIEVIDHPAMVRSWRAELNADHANPVFMVAAALVLFPKLALGLSGFETGVVVMPLVKGDPTDTPEAPAGRIRNTRRLLTAAAVIMSVLLILSSFVTTVLIPHEQFEEGGEANGRALAYLAHHLLGDLFGTVYDVSTITILWFAGASALAGLLNIVPRFLPRYGMAPSWAQASRPLVLIFVAICFLVTVVFRADVDAQAGAYATGVLAVITSASVAVMLAARRKGQSRATLAFGVVAALFVYTMAVTIVEDPEGLQIALLFVAAIVITSLISRTVRSTELRATRVEFDEPALGMLERAAQSGQIRIIANQPDDRTRREYLLKEREEREASNIPTGEPVLFLEVTVADASEFAPTIRVEGEEIEGYQILRATGASVPNTIAAVLLAIRDRTGIRPHVYFGWAEGNPLRFLARFILFGEGDIAPVTREVLRKAEPDPARRPAIHVG